ncbi:galactose-1-phosphate uridylyltransferase [Clostridium acetobutylicum]|nr:galactose-1-phosphate uridylyltransferase [Clostridium acetobutylicum]
MSIRRNSINNTTVIINKKRAERPVELKSENKKEEKVQYEKECPFCIGNEYRTPAVIYDTKEPYHVRVSENKYPIVKEKSMDNNEVFGHHYVVIEGKNHSDNMHEFTKEQMREIIKAYKNTVYKLYENEDIKYVQIFKNCGKDSGASLKHPHSQIVGINIVPDEISREIKGTKKYYEENKECFYCSRLKKEVQYKKRIIHIGKYFTAFCPYDSTYQYKVTIMKNQHQSNFGLDELEMMELGEIITLILKKLNNISYNCSYNMCFHFLKEENEFYHFYVDIIPRLNPMGGFELGTGIMINTVDPEVAAEIFRNIQL